MFVACFSWRLHYFKTIKWIFSTQPIGISIFFVIDQPNSDIQHHLSQNFHRLVKENHSFHLSLHSRTTLNWTSKYSQIEISDEFIISNIWTWLKQINKENETFAHQKIMIKRNSFENFTQIHSVSQFLHWLLSFSILLNPKSQDELTWVRPSK